MIVETIRLTTTAFGHATYGVNALLAGIPRAVGDAEPRPLVSIVDATESEEAARGDDTPDWPGIVTLIGGAPDVDPEVGTIFRDGFVELVHAYITRDADLAETFVEASLTLRAMRKSIAGFLNPANDLDRRRENIEVLLANRMRAIPWGAVIPGYPDLSHGGALAVRYHVRDHEPVI